MPPSGPPELMLEPAAVRALERMRTAAHVVVSGPGGCGKTALLHSLDERFTVVDDADLRSDEAIRQLSRQACDGQAFAIGHRVLHRNRRLDETIRGLGPDVVRIRLGPLRRDQVARFVRERVGAEVTEDHASALFELTTGVPAFLLFAMSSDPFGSLAPMLHALTPGARRLVLALALGAPLDHDLLGPALDLDASALLLAVDAARAASALRPDGVLVPIVAQACRASADPEERATTLRALVAVRQGRRQPIRALAVSLLESPVAAVGQAELLVEAGREAMRDDPALAARLLAAAGDAGASVTDLAPALARARALAGDLDGALRGVDDAAHIEEGLIVAASVLARRGELARTADVLAGARHPQARHLAAIALVATGSWRTAIGLLDDPGAGGLLDTLTRTMAQGVLASVDGASTTALSTLLSAVSMADTVDRPVLLPDSPTALAAQYSLHLGEFGLAEDLLAKAGNRPGGIFTARELLLEAYRAMLVGDADAAQPILDRARAVERLEPREALFAAAVDLGLARRAGDLRALEAGWRTAYHALLAHPVDLFTLLPLGELAIAAARLGRWHQVSAHVEQAAQLLRQSGSPSSWAVLPCWHGMHAALVAGDAAQARHHHGELVRHRDRTTLGRALVGAADCWIAFGDGRVDVDAVEQEARTLHDVGLVWDATRLAGQAAIRTTDRAAITRLLDLTRQLSPSADGTGGGVLSEREQQVARLVVDGLTYRQIGTRLFISAKTVEHHVARIRHKIGSRNRRDLLTALEELLAD